jgi:hypothetical protein
MKPPEFFRIMTFRKASFNKSVRKAGNAASGAIKTSARKAFYRNRIDNPVTAWSNLAYKGISNG